VVDAVGTAVSRFKPGDAVYYVDGGFGIYPGSYAEFKLVGEHYLARKPSTLSFEEAAALRLRQTAILEEGARVIDEGGLRVLLVDWRQE
jgi:NADPH:quinone reductase-like Zn-dependent oxidoreductase